MYKQLIPSIIVIGLFLSSCGGTGKTADGTHANIPSDSVTTSATDTIDLAEEKPTEPDSTLYFSPTPLPDSVFRRMDGVSYHDFSPVAPGDLRFLPVMYVNFEGCERSGAIICHRDIANDLAEIFKELFQARYPIAEIEPVDKYDGDDCSSMNHNNTTCYNCRRTTAGTKLSRHAYGMAIDINPLQNPYVHTSASGRVRVEPEGGRTFLDRKAALEGMITSSDLCCRLFKAHGFRWGGDWRGRVKDYQHFEKP